MKKIYKLFFLLVLLGLNGGALWAQNDFTALQGLIDVTPNNGTLTLSADYTATSSESRISISGKSITLDLNGHVINRNLSAATTEGNVIYIASGATLTIVDSNPTATHNPAITYTNPNDNGSVTVNGGIIMGGCNNSNGGGVYNAGTFNLNRGTITKNSVITTATYNGGGGVYNCGVFNMEGEASISGNTSKNIDTSTNSITSYGGGVSNYGRNATFTLVSGTISNNTIPSVSSSHNGGGVYNGNGALFQMNGGTISGNVVPSVEKSGRGGGVYNDYSGSRFILTDGSIVNNSARFGGGVDNSGIFTMEGGTISQNTGRNFGGGVSNSSGIFNFNDGSITYNSSNVGGSGIYLVNGGTVTMTGGTLSNNYGSGVYINTSSSVFNFEGGEVSSNVTIGIVITSNGTCNMMGGQVLSNGEEGVYLTYGTFNMSGGEIKNNSETGLMCYSDYNYNMTANISGGTFENNYTSSSSEVGKGIRVYQGTLNLSDNPAFDSNQDICLYCTKTSDDDPNGYRAVITKAGDITSVNAIPVTVGYSNRTNLYDGRNIIESGVGTVTESDYNKFTLLNQTAYNNLLIIDRFTAQDEGTGNPVIELHDLAACWGGSGTSADPYRIEDAADLVCLANEVNAGTDYAGIYFQMTQDIDLSSVCGESIGNWTPIGGSTPFKGYFDGGTHTITGLYINGLDDYQGLFGYIADGAQVNNLTLGESTISGKEYVGLVGMMYVNSGNTVPSINNCTTLSSVNVTGYKWVGGMCGWSFGNFSSCINNATIVGNREILNPEYSFDLSYTGGIVGGSHPLDYHSSDATGAYAVSMTDCTNNGTVTSDDFVANGENHYAIAVGGIGGLLEGVVLTGCTNTAQITGTAVVGGISGGTDGNVVYPSKFIQCNNSGDVTALAIVGGISGDNDGTTNESVYDNCQNTGDLSGHYCAGGIIGRYNTVSDIFGEEDPVITSPVIRNCSNTGNVVLEEGVVTFTITMPGITITVDWIGNAGGIAGMLTDVDIENCTNTGDVTGNTGYAGGIVAESERINVSHCHNEGNVQVTDNHELTINDLQGVSMVVGGLVGYTFNSTITASYNTGNVNGGVFTAGIVGFIDSNVEAVSKCFNLGVVESNTQMGLAGGIVGNFSVEDDVTQTTMGINNCYNAGPVIGHGAAGGIVAFCETNVKDCYNVGYIKATDGGVQGLTFNGSAGIVGTFNSDNGIVPTITNCYYDKQMCPTEYDYTRIDLSTFTFEPYTASGDNLLTTNMVGTGMQSMLTPTEWSFVNGLYPQLNVVSSSNNTFDTEASLVSVTPMFLANEETVDQVLTSPFTVGTGSALEWIHVDGNNLLSFNGSDVTWSDYGTEMVAVRHTTDTQIQKLIKVRTSQEPFAGDTWVDVVVTEPEDYDDLNIDSPEDLAWFCSKVNGFHGQTAQPHLNGVITADIDLSAHCWVPIGFDYPDVSRTINTYYGGSFDGNYHNIDGINIDYPSLKASPVLNPQGNSKENRDHRDNIGFFGVTEQAYIHNVILASGTISGYNDENYENYMGGMVGFMMEGRIRNCVSNLTLTRSNYEVCMGGLVGRCDSGEILNCTSVATLEANQGMIGGLIGTEELTLISNCYSNAKFNVQPLDKGDYSTYVGGIYGSLRKGESGNVSNCYVLLRDDSEYGLTTKENKDGGGDPHLFGLFAAASFNGSFSHCYVPSGTNYPYVAEASEIRFAKATSMDAFPSYNKEHSYSYTQIATVASGNQYHIMPWNLNDAFVSLTGSTQQVNSVEFLSESYDDEEQFRIDRRSANDNTNHYGIRHKEGNEYDLGYDNNTGMLVGNISAPNPTWDIEQFPGENSFKVSNYPYTDICLALHNNGDDTYTFGAYSYSENGSDPNYDFHINFFTETEIPSDGNLYGCGTFTASSYPYTYADPRGGTIVTLGNADENDYATSGETTLLDALNNWVVGNYVGNPELFNTYAPDPDWARFGSGLNGDYPVHCYYDPDNIKPADANAHEGGDEFSPTAKVIVTTDKTNGYPFRYYHHVADALTYCNAQTDGGIVCVYGSDDMRNADTQENDANVDVYVNGMTYMQCDKLKSGAPYTYYTFFGDNAAAKSTDWYVSLLQDENKSLTVTTGFNLDNSDATDFAGANYDWHMVSSPLTAIPVGISYPDQDQHDLNNLPECTWDANADGLFPDDTPYGSFDFYAYSEPYYHWMNFKRNSNSHWFQDTGAHIEGYENDQTLVPGHGYLIAMDKEVFMQAKGELNNGNVEVDVTYSGEHNKGLNYLGNPYQSSLDFDAFVTENSGLWANHGDDVNLEYNQSYLILDADEHCYKYYAQDQSNNPDQLSRYIWPFQGFYVGVYTPGTATFTNDMRVIGVNRASYMRNSKSDRNDYPLVNLKVTDVEDKSDMFTVELGRPEWGGSRKEKDMTAGSGMLWSRHDDKEYSILFSGKGVDEIPVRFSAKKAGTFTMTWSHYNGDFTYLHLIDNMTGVDIDCLTTDSYSFEGQTDDYQSRFKLVFSMSGEDDDDDDDSTEAATFAFQMGDGIVVNGEGMLQMFDVNGRCLMSSELYGAQNTISLPTTAAGVYVLRLTSGENVKVQKMVVR